MSGWEDGKERRCKAIRAAVHNKSCRWFSKKAQSQTIHDRESVEVAKYRKEEREQTATGDSAADILSRDAYRVSALHIVISTYSPL